MWGLVACGTDSPALIKARPERPCRATREAGVARADVGIGGSSNTAGLDGSSADGVGREETPFERPDVEVTYVPESGTCGFDAPRFLRHVRERPDHEQHRRALGRTRSSCMERDAGRPVGARESDAAFPIGPALLPPCRAGQPKTVLPGADVLICDPVPTRPTRHLLTIAAAQNYGLATYRIRRPFDFAGRTGTIKFDADLTNNALGGWPAIVISQDPSPAPSFDWEERGSGPRQEWRSSSTAVGATRLTRFEIGHVHVP